MLKQSMCVILFATSHATYTAYRTFMRTAPKFKFTIPLAIMGITHLAQKTIYAQPITPDPSEIQNVQLTAVELIILKKLIQENKDILKADLIKKTAKAHSQEEYSTQTFTIKNPTPLSEEERRHNIIDRISKHYIGELPEKITDIIAHFEKKRDNVGKSMSNAILLHGEPGDGKSFLVETLAQQLQIDYLYGDAGGFIDKYSGESSKKIVNFFELAQSTNKPLFIFLDEVDAIAVTRDGKSSEYRSALTTLLIQSLSENSRKSKIVNC